MRSSEFKTEAAPTLVHHAMSEKGVSLYHGFSFKLSEFPFCTCSTEEVVVFSGAFLKKLFE